MVAHSFVKTESVFDYTWKQVVQAYWNRYPNPSSTHVLTEDTIAREVRDGKLYSRRLLSKTNPVPKWGERFYKNVPIRIIEDSVVDPETKTLVTFTRNIGMTKIMKVDEIVEYSEKDGRTIAVRKAYVSSQVFGFARAIRALGVERFKANTHKASNGFNYVLRQMFPHHVARIVGANNASNLHFPNIDGNTNKPEQFSSTPAATTSKTETVKKAVKASYVFVKCQASKVGQLFSVRN